MNAVENTKGKLLDVRDLCASFPAGQRTLLGRRKDWLKAVDGVSLSLGAGEVLGLAGESGCGKSTLGRCIVGLQRPTSGAIELDGVEISSLKGDRLRKARTQAQMVFQDPLASLNPRLTAQAVLSEALRVRGIEGRDKVRARTVELLEAVGLGSARLNHYPHQLSGGQRQRLSIARALAVEPKLIVADEPVSALDVSIRAQILGLLDELRKARGLAVLLVAHDLAIMRIVCDRLAIMYLGRIVELGPARDVIDRPMHPYTQALVSAVPVPDPERERKRAGITLEGDPPSPLDMPKGCGFHPRCVKKMGICDSEKPFITDRGHGRSVACHLKQG